MFRFSLSVDATGSCMLATGSFGWISLHECILLPHLALRIIDMKKRADAILYPLGEDPQPAEEED